MATTISGSTGVTYPSGGVDNTSSAGVGTTDTQTLTNKTLGSGLVAGASYLTTGTSQASTSGTTIDFTSIPSWVKRITVMFNGVSTSGTSNYLVQLATGGSVVTTGYASTSQQGTTSATATNGFLASQNATAARFVYGLMNISLLGSNTYIASGTLADYTAACAASGGGITLAGAVDRVRITTVNGTDTFDAGSINILYE